MHVSEVEVTYVGRLCIYVIRADILSAKSYVSDIKGVASKFKG